MLRLGIVRLCALAAALGAPGTPASADVTWSGDGAHSSVSLSVSHMLLSKINGAMPIASATMITADGDTIPRSVDVALNAASLSTGDAQRDVELRSDHFFDCARFPSIAFVSRRVVGATPTTFSIEGELTLHGVTRALTLDGRVAGLTRDGTRRRVRYEATGRFRRSDYGMSYARGIVGNDVRLDVVIEAFDSETAR